MLKKMKMKLISYSFLKTITSFIISIKILLIGFNIENSFSLGKFSFKGNS